MYGFRARGTQGSTVTAYSITQHGWTNTRQGPPWQSDPASFEGSTGNHQWSNKQHFLTAHKTSNRVATSPARGSIARRRWDYSWIGTRRAKSNRRLRMRMGVWLLWRQRRRARQNGYGMSTVPLLFNARTDLQHFRLYQIFLYCFAELFSQLLFGGVSEWLRWTYPLDKSTHPHTLVKRISEQATLLYFTLRASSISEWLKHNDFTAKIKKLRYAMLCDC